MGAWGNGDAPAATLIKALARAILVRDLRTTLNSGGAEEAMVDVERLREIYPALAVVLAGASIALPAFELASSQTSAALIAGAVALLGLERIVSVASGR